MSKNCNMGLANSSFKTMFGALVVFFLTYAGFSGVFGLIVSEKASMLIGFLGSTAVLGIYILWRNNHLESVVEKLR